MGGDGNGNGDGDGVGNGNGGKQPPPKNGSGRIAPPPPHPPQQCPRCFSTTTKFCYYNNHCASQPRYLCKSCRRYWTLGGALRDIPIGGNSRKGTKQMTKDSLASGSLSSCSSYIGECSRVQEHHSPLRPPLPPPPPPSQLSLPYMRGLSYMGLSFPNSLTSPGGIFSSFATMQNLNRSQGFNQVPPNGGGHIGGTGGIHGAHSTSFSLLQGSSSSPNMPRPPQIQQPVYQFQNGQQAMAQPSRPVGSLIQANNNPSTSNINVTWASRNNIPGFGSGPAMNNQNQWSDEFDVDDVDDLFSGSSPTPPPF